MRLLKRSALVLAVLAPSTALATDSGYHTVDWFSYNDDDEVHIVLSSSSSVYYKCETDEYPSFPKQCLIALQVALTFGREVKLFYSSGSGTSSSPYIVDTLRMEGP